MIVDPHTIAMKSEPMPIGGGITVTFSMKGGAIDAAFAPSLPKGGKAKPYHDAYRHARDEFLRRVAIKTGLTVGVVEL